MTCDERVAEIMSHLVWPFHRLREAEHNLPTNDEMRTALAGRIKSDGQWRKTRPKSEDAEVLWTLVKFHRGSGNLSGWPWFAPRDLVDKFDTAVQCMLLVTGQPMTAVSAWQRVLS